MILGIGIDLIETQRIKKACQKEAFLIRYFTLRERSLIKARPEATAGNFAVKEAVVKAFGTGFRGIEPIEIEVLRSSGGSPYVKLYGGARAQAELLGVKKIHVSITNTKMYAAAYVVAEGKSDTDEIYCKSEGNAGD